MDFYDQNCLVGICLDWGTEDEMPAEEGQAAKGLREMLDIAPEWKEYVQDNKIHVFDF